jgi:ankyrin repeat protein
MACRIALLLVSVVCASCGVVTPSAEDLRNDSHGHLVWAARRGDVAAIRGLAARGVDLNASGVTRLAFIFPDFDHRRWTALQHAVQKRQTEAVRVLLEWGAEPDATEPGTVNTPLFIAASYNDRQMVKWLLDAGADVNWVSRASAQEPGGPLWHLIEHVVQRVQGIISANDALELVRETAGSNTHESHTGRRGSTRSPTRGDD